MMAGLPVTIRLLDPPLHEFLPHTDERDRRGRAGAWAPVRRSCSAAPRELHEFNPMLGFRGCRLAITYPEIAEMQVRAIFEAAVEAAQATASRSMPEVMVPLVDDAGRSSTSSRRASTPWPQAVAKETGAKVDYQVGTMIELPRAALRAGEIAETRRVLLLRHERPDPDDARHLARRRRDVPRRLHAEGHPADGPVRDASTSRRRRRARRDRRRARPQDAARHQARHLRRAWRRSGLDRDSASEVGLDYVSCSPFRVPIARLAAAQAALGGKVASQA